MALLGVSALPPGRCADLTPAHSEALSSHPAALGFASHTRSTSSLLGPWFLEGQMFRGFGTEEGMPPLHQLCADPTGRKDTSCALQLWLPSLPARTDEECRSPSCQDGWGVHTLCDSEETVGKCRRCVELRAVAHRLATGHGRYFGHRPALDSVGWGCRSLFVPTAGGPCLPGI